MSEMIWSKGDLIVTRVNALCHGCGLARPGKRFTGPEGHITMCDFCNVEYGVQLMARLDVQHTPAPKKTGH